MKRILVEEEVFDRFVEVSLSRGTDQTETLRSLLDKRDEDQPTTSQYTYSIDKLQSWRRNAEMK